MKAGALMASAALCALAAHAAPPTLAVQDGQPGLPGSRVAPNLLLHLSLTAADAGAAYRDAYSAETEYGGYFNPRMCYSYPYKTKAGAKRPDLGDQAGYFSPVKTADAKRQCGGDSFSGNLLNWASMSRLDLLRLAMTGGDRIIDDKSLTVLQRAWLPETLGAAVPAEFIAADQRCAAGRGQPFGRSRPGSHACRMALNGQRPRPVGWKPSAENLA